MDYRKHPTPAPEIRINLSSSPDQPPALSALAAAVEAFAAARSARRLLDNSGRLGADAVVRARPISGARRASVRAQTAVEQSALQMDKARDRWGALMRGLAADLDISPEDLVIRVESAAVRLGIRDVRAAIAAGLEAANSGISLGPGYVSALQAALAALSQVD